MQLDQNSALSVKQNKTNVLLYGPLPLDWFLVFGQLFTVIYLWPSNKPHGFSIGYHYFDLIRYLDSYTTGKRLQVIY